MGRIDNLFAKTREVQSKLETILSLEQDINEKESIESAELQKAGKIASRLKSANSEELLAEEIEDFVEAIKLFRNISEELHKTADDIHSVVDEIEANIGEELKIIEGISNGQVQITAEDAEELAETVNTSHININKLVEESQRARKEAQKAQKELEKLGKLEELIQNFDQNKHDLSKPKMVLEKAEKDLQDAEWKLGEIPNKVKEAKNRSERTAKHVEDNTDMERRSFVRGAGAVGAAAIIGLPGCMGGRESETQSIKEILESPGSFKNRTVTVNGFPEYEGELSYTLWVYSPSTKSSVPTEVAKLTYRLYSESGDGILFNLENKPELLRELNHGERLDQEIRVSGRFEKAENEEGQAFWVIARSKVEIL